MCFGSRRRPRRRATFRSEKGSLSALKRLVVTSTLISPAGTGVNLNTIDAPEGEKQDFLVFLSDVIRKHLRRVYDEQKGARLSLSRDQFAVFLKETQHAGDDGDSVKPLELESYTFSQFLWTWYRDYGWRAMRRAAPKDLSQPISNYFINSSHNTFLEGNQWSSRSTSDAYRNVLRKDCRCIEIDVWNGEGSNRTPSRSRSPHPGGHGRHLSSVSLPSAAASALEAVEGKYESVKDILSGKPHQHHHLNLHLHPHHHRKSSSNLEVNRDASSAGKDSTTGQDPNADNERHSRSRATSKGSRHSSYTKGEPIVMHGYTLTAPVGFREVCKAIRETAFVNNDLPIIVSLQVGATVEQQEVMVEIMKEEWHGLLLDRPHDTCDPRSRQPRLDELLKKILVKVKRAPENNGSKESSSTGQATLSPLSPNTTFDSGDAFGLEEGSAPPPPPPPASPAEHSRKKGKNDPICASLGALAIYTHSEHFESFDSAKAKSPGHIFSLKESHILRLHASNRKELLAHNASYFMRAYPSPRRVLSSNLDPSLFWRKGVQMVAMNWQSWDEGMMLNWGMFAGEKGWILKPPAYRSGGAAAAATNGTAVEAKEGQTTTTSPTTTQQQQQKQQPKQRTLDLRITFFAGQHIPLPEAREKLIEQSQSESQGGFSGARDLSFRPYIKCALHVEKSEENAAATAGVASKGKANGKASGDNSKNSNGEKPNGGGGGYITGYTTGEFKRVTKAGETDYPDFGRLGETVEFRNVSVGMEELSFVRFKIQEDSSYYGDALAAWACIRLDRLRQGYRFIDLMNPQGSSTAGKLFVHVEKIVH